MSIISEIGRRNYKVRLFMFSVYVILILGTITMVYPFWLMIVGASKSSCDSPESEMIPSFFVNDISLYRKTVEGYYNEVQSVMQASYGLMNQSFRNLKPPEHINQKLVDEWNTFQDEQSLPFYYYGLAFVHCKTSLSTIPLEMRKFKALLKEKYGSSIDNVNQKLGTSFSAWSNVYISPADYVQRRNRPGMAPFNLEYRAFKEKQGHVFRYYFSPEGAFKTEYLKAQYSKNIMNYNKLHGTKYKSWDDVHFTRRCPKGKEYSDLQRKDWAVYVRMLLNLFWIRADKKAEPLYQEYLKVKYSSNIIALNRLYSTSYQSFSEVPIVGVPPIAGACLSDWDSFVQGWKDQDNGKTYILPLSMIHIHSIDFMFRDFLIKKYGSIAKINTALDSSFKSALDIVIPQQQTQYEYVMNNKASIRTEFCIRNFLTVFEYILLQGRAIFNTIIYCALAVLCCLIVNPLAAYALSRYRPPSTYKILLFMMLTMAFPPMVTQIPVFLMLRELNLLNSFAALILPGLANGYSIFLLKGFFDSLPQELYESASLDGAGEFRIFWQITMSLSTPILAVIALQAFNLAYANFMMALLVCQDDKMWTLMPWLYQLQQRSGQGVIFASLIIAAVPTFLVFLFCQNIIMRGIVVPVEK